jgi:glycosyltransferase involved in cell wall biosynthesis
MLKETVIFTGHTTDMPTVYNGLDIVVSASTSPEPLGTVVIESMTMGRPLIGPNHGGAAEMMEHEKTGLLFEPGNADDLALVISQFYNSVELREKLGKSAREHALKTFAVEEHVRHVQKVYTEVFRKFNQE